MAQDPVTEEAIKKVEEKEKKKRAPSRNIPPIYIILGLAAVFFLILYVNNKGGGSEAWAKVIPWVIAFVIGMIFLSQRDVKVGKIMEDEMKALLKKRIAEKKLNGEIPNRMSVYVDLRSGLQHVDGKPNDYCTGIVMIDPETRMKYYLQATVDSMDGNITFQDAMGRVTGHELPQIVNPIPKIFKLQEQYSGMKKLFKGGGGGGSL